MYTAVRTIRRKALVGFARQRELHGVSAPRDGVRTLAEELSSGESGVAFLFTLRAVDESCDLEFLLSELIS